MRLVRLVLWVVGVLLVGVIPSRPGSSVHAAGASQPAGLERGAGVTVYVIDSGVVSHRRLGNVERLAGTSEGLCPEHGTAVASVVTEVAPGVRIVDIPVIGCDGRSNTGLIDEALVQVIEHHDGGLAVVNMSLAGSLGVLSERFDEVVADGVVPVLAAGNDGVDACFGVPQSPAVLVVGASDGDEAAEWSNHGECVDVWAPGVSVVAAAPTGWEDEVLMNGTSLATPHVAGALARLVEAGTLAGADGVQTAIDELLARTVERDGQRFLDPYVGKLGVPWGVKAEAGDRSATLTWHDTLAPGWEVIVETIRGEQRVLLDAAAVVRDGSRLRYELRAQPGRALRVRVSRVGGEPGSWSARVTPVRVKARGTGGAVSDGPLVRAVANARGGPRQVAVSWKRVKGSERYTIVWSKNGVVRGRVTVGGTSAVLERFAAGVWSVQVRAENAGGVGAWSKRTKVKVTS